MAQRATKARALGQDYKLSLGRGFPRRVGGKLPSCVNRDGARAPRQDYKLSLGRGFPRRVGGGRGLGDVIDGPGHLAVGLHLGNVP